MFLQRPSNPNHNHVLYYDHECWALEAQGPSLMYNHEWFYNDPVPLITNPAYFNPTVQACMFLQRPSNPNHNHAYFYSHECWAQGPTLKYKHECFYNDPVTLITTMHISTAMSAGSFGPTRPNPNVQP